MSPILHPRQDWLPQDEKAFPGAAGFSKETVVHLTAHYAGVASLDLDGPDNVYQDTDTASLILGMHRYYWSSRGYGLGYSFVCDWHKGDLWTVRGFSVRAASDGSAPTNMATVSCLFLTPGLTDDVNGDLSPVQINSAQYLASLVRGYCGQQVTKWVGHRDVYATPCPGDAIYRRVKAGELWPSAPTPEPPTPRSPSMLAVCTDSPDWPGIGLVLDLSSWNRVPPEKYAVYVATGYAPADTLKLPKVAWAAVKDFL